MHGCFFQIMKCSFPYLMKYPGRPLPTSSAKCGLPHLFSTTARKGVQQGYHALPGDVPWVEKGRLIDLHLKGLTKMGRPSNWSMAPCPCPYKGPFRGWIYLDFPSVGATENLMMAVTRFCKRRNSAGEHRKRTGNFSQPRRDPAVYGAIIEADGDRRGSGYRAIPFTASNHE